ncbi:MAG: hypothetical protein K5984_00740 [Bacteroidales bacterium]|nr:hypothetical protein [Bacteroidales bacterium]
MSFTGEIRKLLTKTGAVTEKVVADTTVFEAEGVAIIPIPLSDLTLEDAVRTHDRVLEAASAFDKPVIFLPQDRWKVSEDMMRARLLAHLGEFTSVFARFCEVRRIDKPAAAAFLSDTHSYGDASCRYRYGLFLKRDYKFPKGTMVAVSEFSNPRRWNKDGVMVSSYEWVRYSSLPEVRVIGGMGKMLKAFIEDVHPDDVMTYADLEWSDGRAYRELGFEKEGSRESVDFVVDPLTWFRQPLRGEEAEGLFYRNFGSIKYRLKLTASKY